jgi:cytochrome oxidase assembly protein ShyY1
LLGVIVISVIFVFLGRWQYHRHEAKVARNDLVKSNYSATPVALSDLIPTQGQVPTATLPKTREWRPVALEGTYLTADTILIRNRPHDQFQLPDDGSGNGNSQNGYEVVVPLRTVQGAVLLVDRGWIPAGTASAARPDSVPAPPSGPVRVVARLRPSEDSSSRKAPAGQATRIAVPQLAATLTGADAQHVVGAYGLMASETPAGTDTPAGSAKPDSGLGINLAYAVQWVGFAITAYILLGVAMVREIRRRDNEPPTAPTSTPTRATYR